MQTLLPVSADCPIAEKSEAERSKATVPFANRTNTEMTGVTVSDDCEFRPRWSTPRIRARRQGGHRQQWRKGLSGTRKRLTDFQWADGRLLLHSIIISNSSGMRQHFDFTLLSVAHWRDSPETGQSRAGQRENKRNANELESMCGGDEAGRQAPAPDGACSSDANACNRIQTYICMCGGKKLKWDGGRRRAVDAGV